MKSVTKHAIVLNFAEIERKKAETIVERHLQD